MVELSPRLEQIGRMVAPGSVVADIGTDHGQLMAWLGERGILRAGYACDINKKPLDKARRILAELGLSDMVACVQAPGLEGLEPGSADTVVIAGMGGDLIARILDEAPWVRKHRTRLLLQPMTKPDHLRDYLAREGFCTELENAVVSGKFVYTVFSVVYDGQPRTLTTLERYIGRVLDGDSADTDRYLMRVRRNLLGRIAGIDRSRAGDPERRGEYTAVVAELERLLKERGYDVDCLDAVWEVGRAGALPDPGEVG